MTEGLARSLGTEAASPGSQAAASPMAPLMLQSSGSGLHDHQCGGEREEGQSAALGLPRKHAQLQAVG